MTLSFYDFPYRRKGKVTLDIAGPLKPFPAETPILLDSLSLKSVACSQSQGTEIFVFAQMTLSYLCCWVGP